MKFHKKTKLLRGRSESTVGRELVFQTRSLVFQTSQALPGVIPVCRARRVNPEHCWMCHQEEERDRERGMGREGGMERERGVERERERERMRE